MVKRIQGAAAHALMAMLFAFPAVAEEGPATSRGTFTLLGADGAPLAGARVSVVGRAGGALTDSEGKFILEPEPTAPFDLAVFDPGGVFLGLIRVERAPRGGVTLRLPAAGTERVTVRAGIAPSTPAPPAAAATLFSSIDREELRPDRLVDVMEGVPGTSRLEDGQSGVPVLRGMARGRSLVLLDDARVSAERRAGPSGTFMDPFSFGNVEIVRGPGSLAYGSDAIGGVLHARTPLPRLDENEGRYEIAAGFASPLTAGGLEWNFPVGNGALLAQAHGRRFGDYESPEGTAENSSASDYGGLVRGLFPSGEMRYLFGVQANRGSDIGKPSADSDLVSAYYPTESSNRVNFGIDFPRAGGFSSLELRTFFGTYRLVTTRDRAANPTTTRQVSEADVDSKDASARLVATRHFSQGYLRLGLDAAGRIGLHADQTITSYDPNGNVASVLEESPVESARGENVGVFAEGERVFADSKVSIAAGVRGDGAWTTNSGGFFGDQSTSDGALSGYAAVTVPAGGTWRVTLQAAQGFREPTLSDRYFRGVTGRGFAIGNPELTAETSEQYDLAVRGRAGRARLAFYAYEYRIEDLVERYQSPTGDFLFRNRGEEKIDGAEAEISVDIPMGMAARFGAALLHGRITDDDSPASDIPPASASFSLQQRRSAYWWRAGVEVVAGKDDVGPTEQATSSYSVVDVGGGVALPGRTELRLLVRNVTDRTYLGTADALAVPAPGRSATLTFAGRF
jgi:iron complex outermembrane receptor protein